MKLSKEIILVTLFLVLFVYMSVAMTVYPKIDNEIINQFLFTSSGLAFFLLVILSLLGIPVELKFLSLFIIGLLVGFSANAALSSEAISSANYIFGLLVFSGLAVCQILTIIVMMLQIRVPVKMKWRWFNRIEVYFFNRKYLVVVIGFFAIIALNLFVFGVVYNVYGRLGAFNQEITSFDAWYFSFITCFTIGYGDISPKSDQLKILVMIQTTVSYLITTLFAPLLITAFLKARKNVVTMQDIGWDNDEVKQLK